MWQVKCHTAKGYFLVHTMQHQDNNTAPQQQCNTTCCAGGLLLIFYKEEYNHFPRFSQFAHCAGGLLLNFLWWRIINIPMATATPSKGWLLLNFKKHDLGFFDVFPFCQKMLCWTQQKYIQLCVMVEGGLFFDANNSAQFDCCFFTNPLLWEFFHFVLLNTHKNMGATTTIAQFTGWLLLHF